LDEASLLFDKNLKQEIANKEAQFIALQHQINPHFIYNTMEVFSSKMEIYGHYEESEAMTAFADMFRYNINKTLRVARVSEEIAQAKSYIDIQKLRCPNLELIIQVSEELAEQKIIRFIFQPLIENCISHGIANPKDALKIQISAYYMNNNSEIAFTVCDYGRGIPAAKLDEINRALQQPPADGTISSGGSSIGLYNINRRLKLFYGDEYCLQISSSLNEWTLVSFKIKQYE
jgi:sensor histidine kinase YesM